jgi:hypothetical protein
MTTAEQPLQLCDSPGDMNTGLKLTPTALALYTLVVTLPLLTSANEARNATTMVKRYDGTNQLWGTLDFAWWCFFANWVECNVTEFFAETEHMLDFGDNIEEEGGTSDFDDFDDFEDEEDEISTGD